MYYYDISYAEIKATKISARAASLQTEFFDPRVSLK
jgi:hypothetical protein